MTLRSRSVRLAAIGLALMATGAALWLTGLLLDVSLARYAGLMTMGTTFVPLPADTFTLVAAAHNPALAVALVGGSVNTAVVLVERHWILLLLDHPMFDRVRRFFDTNRWVAFTDRSMFATLLLAGFLFFEPFRLLAVMRRYPPVKYAAATFISRTIRYYALATVGAALFELGYLTPLLVCSLGLFALGLARSGMKLARERRLGAAVVVPGSENRRLMPESDLDRVLSALRPEVVMEGPRTGVAWFHPQPEHRGVPGWVHGGFAAVVLDHVCARTAAHVLGERVVTGTLDLRYPQPLPLDGGPYRIEAEAAPHKGRLVKLRGAVVGGDGRQMVQAKALFVTLARGSPQR